MASEGGGSDSTITILACPACDSPTIYRRITEPESDRWRCADCDETFPDPVERGPKPPHDGGRPRRKARVRAMDTGFDPDREIKACPECDDPRIYERDSAADSERWRCGACGATFPEPLTRPPKERIPPAKGQGSGENNA